MNAPVTLSKWIVFLDLVQTKTNSVSLMATAVCCHVSCGNGLIGVTNSSKAEPPDLRCSTLCRLPLDPVSHHSSPNKTDPACLRGTEISPHKCQVSSCDSLTIKVKSQFNESQFKESQINESQFNEYQFNESRFNVKSRFKVHNLVTKMKFHIKKSRFKVM